jgi:hypothetical protein
LDSEATTRGDSTVRVPQRRTFVCGNVLSLVAFDFVLRIVRAGVLLAAPISQKLPPKVQAINRSLRTSLAEKCLPYK